jgi:TonB family protein
VRTMAARSPIQRYAVGAAAVLAILAGMILWRSNEQHTLSPVVRATTETQTTQEQVADYLARANIALATGRLVEPKGDNALEFYQRVLAIQSGRREAQTGIQRTIDALAKRIDAAIATRSVRVASSSLAQLERVQPNHPRLGELRTAVSSLQRQRAPTPALVAQDADPSAATAVTSPESSPQPEGETTPVQAPAEAAATAQDPSPSAHESSSSSDSEAVISEELSIATRLRERGILIEPPGDNAFERLLELRARSPESESVRTEQQRLAFALLERARTSLAANDIESTDRFLKAADTLIPGMNTTRGLQQQLQAARAQAVANTVIQAALVPRRKEVAASYPLDARKSGLEGWVDVEFTITPAGDTSDLVVRNADPRDVFEKAALDAVKHWKFEPILKDGTPAAQRAILRVRFSMANDSQRN